MSSNKKESPNEAKSRVRNRPLPEIEAMIARLQLPSELIHYARGAGHSVCWNFLNFGHVYRLRRTIIANRRGSLVEGDQVRFLGAYVFPYDNGLRLYFERYGYPGEDCSLEFEGNFPESERHVRMLGPKDEGIYFTPVQIQHNQDQRRVELLDAKRILRQAALTTQNLAAKAQDDALLQFQKRLLALQEEHSLYGPACTAVYEVNPDTSISQALLDHATLLFGHTYIVTQDARANRQGELVKGTRVTFLGIETRYGEEVTLAFESEHVKWPDVVFYPTSSEHATDCQPLLHPEVFFEELTDELTEREQLLANLRGVFLRLIEEKETGGSS